MDRSGHLRSGGGDLLVFPYANHHPPCFVKQVLLESVAIHSVREFFAPKTLIRSWDLPVLGAGMPEATINEHGQLASGEGDVRPDKLAVVQPHSKILPKPQTPRVERTS